MEEMIEQTTIIEMLPSEEKKSPAQWHQHWQKEINASEKRLRIYKKQGVQVVQRYLDDRTGAAMMGQWVAQPLTFFIKIFLQLWQCCMAASRKLILAENTLIQMMI